MIHRGETDFPGEVAGSIPLDLGDTGRHCYVNGRGEWSCDHAHTFAEMHLPDIYEQIPGWTAQTPM